MPLCCPDTSAADEVYNAVFIAGKHVAESSCMCSACSSVLYP